MLAIQPAFIEPLALALVLLFALLIAAWWRHREKGVRIPIDAEGGTVEISGRTMRSIIRAAAMAVPGVEHVNCRRLPSAKSGRIDISIRIHVDASLRELVTEVEKRTRKTLTRQFGLENIGPINITVAGTAGKSKDESDELKTMGPENLGSPVHSNEPPQGPETSSETHPKGEKPS